MQARMGMHANTGMYINAQMPTLNTEIAKLQPVILRAILQTLSPGIQARIHLYTHTHTHTQRHECIHSQRQKDSNQWS